MSIPVRLLAGNPGPLTGPGTSTWFLDGSQPVLIDAGIGIPAHLEALATVLQGRPLADVFVTHGHADHASGVPALKERWPSLRAHKWLAHGAEHADWLMLTDGMRVAAGRRTLEVIHTPGHAADHVCFWDPASRELYAGDMIISGSTVMIPAGQGGDLRAYLSSLERMAALDPIRLFPGHGPAIEQPGVLIAEYIEHRRQRESEVRACLAEGVASIDAIVARLYPHIPDAVRPAARLTIAAHLEKLKQEGEY